MSILDNDELVGSEKALPDQILAIAAFNRNCIGVFPIIGHNV
jgi:hypothetical protein